MQITEQQKAENAAKAEQVAKTLYPNEKWEFLEEGIYIAKSRQPTSARSLSDLPQICHFSQTNSSSFVKNLVKNRTISSIFYQSPTDS